VDGDVTMVESIAPAFPAYQQFLHLGEAGLAASIFFVVGARNFAPAAQRQNWTAGQAQHVFDSRLGLVTRQLARSPYLAGEAFTAAAREAYQRAMETCQGTRPGLLKRRPNPRVLGSVSVGLRVVQFHRQRRLPA
jgi:glutathione S-transferase